MKDEHPFRILIVDDNDEMITDIRRELSDTIVKESFPNLKIDTCNDFAEAEKLLCDMEYDLAVLDVREEAPLGGSPDDERGSRAFDIVRSSRFLPVVFFTALPDRVRDYEALPLISVVSKEDMEDLPAAVSAALESGIATTVKTLNNHIESVVRTYLWDTVAPRWTEISGGNPKQLAGLLVSRIIRSLHENGMDEVSKELELYKSASPPADGESDDGAPSAVTHYVYPPVSKDLVPGALIHYKTNQDSLPSEGSAESALENDGLEDWWVVLTPACDFAQRKVEYVLLVRGLRLDASAQYIAWKSASFDDKKWPKIDSIVRGKTARYDFLPHFDPIPDLIIDFEQVLAVNREDLENVDVVATLDSPFTEALLTRYSHFRGRIGTPDLDFKALKSRLSQF